MNQNIKCNKRVLKKTRQKKIEKKKEIIPWHHLFHNLDTGKNGDTQINDGILNKQFKMRLITVNLSNSDSQNE